MQHDGGSSPLARGTRRLRPRGRREPGIIPACAGNTPAHAGSTAACRVHPRLRGEHAPSRESGDPIEGSSPLARGTHLLEGDGARGAGIIPACAGNTAHSTRRSPRARDHPRLRGEHSDVLPGAQRAKGSSPLARGTLGRVQTEPRRDGIIPACAGNTRRLSSGTAVDGDHPRLRGEHHDHALSDGRDDGIIPACAGNTAGSAQRRKPSWDHPRLRGEH